ncbi:MAG: hypothetical protein PHQ72_00620 [Hespellia sp.]|nr:hypothetical protein [Hespellia sp.]
MGYKEKNADVRIAQYEAGTRTPKESAVSVMADILKVSADSINDTSSDMEKEILLFLFWLEEENAELLQVVDSIHGNSNLTQEGKIGIYFTEGKIKVWMQEWMRQRQRLQS